MARDWPRRLTYKAVPASTDKGQLIIRIASGGFANCSNVGMEIGGPAG